MCTYAPSSPEGAIFELSRESRSDLADLDGLVYSRPYVEGKDFATTCWGYRICKPVKIGKIAPRLTTQLKDRPFWGAGSICAYMHVYTYLNTYVYIYI